ncbi:MAG: HD domain-containing protein [Desulfovibrionaceae bacterium]|nr:HD domain-containing protein [Desulfovibrionaceae bacterium]
MAKKIRDPLYGFIEIPDEYLPLVDHKILQRLRWVNQLPLEQLVYPAAQHSRFEHSLGTMHLTRKAAECLVCNSNERFLKITKGDALFKEVKASKRRDIFIGCAGLVGLLHDVGHAPFSHTMEDACDYASGLKFKYNHEYVGCVLAKCVLDGAKELDEITVAICSKVLNKKIRNEQLSPVEVLLRYMIDGPFDVDKGDYIRRDSYHCGVVYGIYDIERLWSNIVITDTNTIGVDAKGALEAWSLRIARYKMTKNAYKHHVRNITDALLIEVISRGLEITSDDTRERKRILPFCCEEKIGIDENIAHFCLWNDNTLIKGLSDLDDGRIATKIESFMSRNLYKRLFEINLTKDFPESKNNIDRLHTNLRKIKTEFSEKSLDFNYIVDKEILPPVFEDEVQKEIRVRDGSKYLSLAEYLGFGVKDGDSDKSYVKNLKLRVFAKRSDKGIKAELQELICKALSEFSVNESVAKPIEHN